MDDLDHRILDALQYDFPLNERPFDLLAARLGIDVEELWHRLERMRRDGTIRRLGASFDSRKLGFCSTLAAVSVEPDRVDRAAEVVGRYDEVTHSYLRDYRFNIWFAVIARDVERINAILEEIRTALSLPPSAVLNLPMKRVFKLDARFRAQR